MWDSPSPNPVCHLPFILFIPSGCVRVCVSICPCMLMCIWITRGEPIWTHTWARVCSNGCQVIYRVHWGCHQWINCTNVILKPSKRREDERTACWGKMRAKGNKWAWQERRGRGDEWQKIKWDTKTAKAKELTMISTNYWPEGTLI